MEGIEGSELLKTVKTLMLFERGAYLLYADAANKMPNPECRSRIPGIAWRQGAKGVF